MARPNNQLTFYTASGNIDRIQGFLFAGGSLSNFIISGGANDVDRYAPLKGVLQGIVGRIPVIIFHGQDDYLESIVAQVWDQVQSVPLWQANAYSPCFEPFFGLSKHSIVTILRKLATKLEYTPTPQLDRIVNAHLRILDLLEIPYSLSGLYYLCQFTDMIEYRDNVMQLPCSENEALRIWSDLDTDDETHSGQFYLFTSVINALADEAARSGWHYSDEISDGNTLAARQEDAVFMLSVDPTKNSLLLTYLMHELQESGNNNFFLLIDGLRISSDMAQYLSDAMTTSYLGILSSNVVGCFEKIPDDLNKLAEHMDYLVVFKHKTSQTASIISDLIGKDDFTKTDYDRGVNRGFFKILPAGVTKSERITTENRFRIMPEKIQSLQQGQAIIFDARTNEITLYNCGRRF